MHAITATAAAQQAAGLSPGGIGLSIGAVALIAGIAIAMHHKRKSPRIIGWLMFICGIPLAGLLSGPLGALAGVSLLAIPISLVLTGYVAFVFFHDGMKRGGGGGRGTVAVRGSGGGGGSGGAHRWLQPLFGLILPALLLTLGGSVGHGIHSGLHAIEGGVGSVVSQTTGQ
jgi:hypothetical protein